MDTTANRARLIAACDTDANAAAAVERAKLRARLSHATQPARRVVVMIPVD